jgi:sec-independent protein translocase protein TatB
MFNIFSLQHVFLLAVIALVAVGPKDLPRLMKLAGNWGGRGRSLALTLRRTLGDLTRTADLDELRAEMNAFKRKYPLSSLEAAVQIRERTPRG